MSERSFSDVYSDAFESIGAGPYEASSFEDFKLRNPLPESDSTDLYTNWQDGVYLTEHPQYDSYTQEQKLEVDEISQKVRYLGYVAITRAGVGLAKSNFLATWDDELGLEAVDNDSVNIYFRFRSAQAAQILRDDGDLEPNHSPELFDEWPETDRSASCLAVALGMAAVATARDMDYKFTTAIKNNASQLSEYHRGHLDEFHRHLGPYLVDTGIDEVVDEVIGQQSIEIPESIKEESTFFDYMIRSRDSRLAGIEAHDQFHHYITALDSEAVGDGGTIASSIDPYQMTLAFSVAEDSPLSKGYKASDTVVSSTRHLELSLVPLTMSLKFLSEKVDALESDIDLMNVKAGSYLEDVIDAVHGSFLECQDSRDYHYKLLGGEYDPEAERDESHDEMVRLLCSNAAAGVVRRYFNDDSAAIRDGGRLVIAPKYIDQMALNTELRDGLEARFPGILIGLETTLYIGSIANLGAFSLGATDAAYEYGDNYFMAGSSYLCNFTSGSKDDTVSLTKELTKVGSSQMIWQSAKVADGFASQELEMEFDQVIDQLPEKAVHPLVSIRRRK